MGHSQLATKLAVGLGHGGGLGLAGEYS